jgi:hypothetical protein
MKKYCTVLLFIPMLTACLKGTLIPDVKQEGWKTGGIYLLHGNPKAGDFAEYHVVGRSVVGGTVELDYYWEGTKTVDIVAINNDIITIREYYTTDRLKRDGGSRLMQVSASPPVLRDIITTPDGRIIEMTVNGVKQQIAVKGENGYMEFSELGHSIPVEVDAGKYTARPSFCQARRGYSIKSCLVNQNNIYDEISIRYLADGAMFRTVIEQMLVTGKLDTTVSTSKMAQLVSMSLTFTPFFANPASLITGAGKGNLKDYLLRSVLPEKKEAAEIVTNNLMDITTKSPFSNSGVAYLKTQGNRYRTR